MSRVCDILGLERDHVEMMLGRALQQYADGEPHEAERILKGVIAIDPKDARPLKLLASIKMLAKRDEEAESLYRKAHRIDPNDPYVLVGLAEFKLANMKFNDAIGLLEQIFHADPRRTHPATNRAHYLVKAFCERMSESQ